MAFKIEWDKVSERFYETGVDRGVLYPMNNGSYGSGVAWNGLIGVSQNPSGAEATPLYADNTKYLNMMSREDFGATVTCYAYPPEFAACNGEKELIPGVNLGQQSRSAFGFTYRTKIGNDEKGSAYGYKIHLVYGAMASPSAKDYQTEGDTPEAIEFSYDITTTPIEVANHEPTAHIEIDSRNFADTAGQAKLTAFENYLYGTKASGSSDTDTEGQMPTIAKIIELLGSSTPVGP